MARVVAGDPGRASLAALYLKGIILAVGLPAAASIMLYTCSERVLGKIDRWGRAVFYAYASFYFVFVVALGVLKTRSFHTYADLATHLEILWRASQGLGLTSLMSEEYWKGSHWFAAHFTPIAYVIALPLFKMFPGSGVLIMLQTVALMSAVIPVMWYARDRLGASAAYWAATSLLLYPTLQYVNLYEFEYLRFSIPFLAWAFYAFHRRWMWTYAVMCGLALLTREEVGLVVFMLGLYALLAKKERLAGGVTMGVALAYSLVVFGVVIPSFRESGGLVYLQSYSGLGNTPREIVGNLLFRPGETLWLVLDPIRLGNGVMFLLPFQFLSLAAPGVLLIALPNVVSTFLSGSVSHYAFVLYYLSPAIPFIAFAAIEGMRSLRDAVGRRGAATPTPGDGEGDVGRATVCVTLFVFLGAFLANVFFGASPLSLQFWNRDYRVGEFYSTNFHISSYLVSPHARVAHAMVKRVPGDAVVSAEQFFLPHLYNRKRIYVFPVLKPDVDYILIDRNHPLKTGWDETYLDFRRRPEYYYRLIDNDPDRWTLVAEADGVQLFARRDGGK